MINIRTISINRKRNPSYGVIVTLGAGILQFSLKGDLSQLPNNISTGSYFTPERANKLTYLDQTPTDTVFIYLIYVVSRHWSLSYLLSIKMIIQWVCQQPPVQASQASHGFPDRFKRGVFEFNKNSSTVFLTGQACPLIFFMQFHTNSTS